MAAAAALGEGRGPVRVDPGAAAVSGATSDARGGRRQVDLRIATYNIHRSRGMDRRVSPSRIAEVLRDIDADIVALQEVVGEPRLGLDEHKPSTPREGIIWNNLSWEHLPPGATVSVLDVASGEGDLLRAIHRWATRRGLRPSLTGTPT